MNKSAAFNYWWKEYGKKNLTHTPNIAEIARESFLAGVDVIPKIKVVKNISTKIKIKPDCLNCRIDIGNGCPLKINSAGCRENFKPVQQ